MASTQQHKIEPNCIKRSIIGRSLPRFRRESLHSQHLFWCERLPARLLSRRVSFAASVLLSLSICLSATGCSSIFSRSDTENRQSQAAAQSFSGGGKINGQASGIPGSDNSDTSSGSNSSGDSGSNSSGDSGSNSSGDSGSNSSGDSGSNGSGADSGVTSFSEETLTTAPDPDEAAREEALQLANLHHVNEDAMQGRYDLFLRYSETVEGNSKLDEFKEYLYLIFPVIAENLKPDQETHFLARVGTLSIACRNITANHAGEYDCSNNAIVINGQYRDSDQVSFYSSLCHELMHFVDSNIDGDLENASFSENAVYPQFDIPSDTKVSLIDSDTADFLMEGGAELFTAKYCTFALETYIAPTQFLTGLELIFGSRWLEDLVFAHDSAYLLAEQMLNNGFTVEEIRRFYRTMDSMAYHLNPPSEPLRPEDVLIRLYEKNMDGSYQDDAVFCYILSCICDDEYDFDTYPSEYRDFLEPIALIGDRAVDRARTMVQNMYLDNDIALHYVPLCGIYLDGEFVIAAPICVYEEDGTEKDWQILLSEYDFDNDCALSRIVFELKTPESGSDA
ncbi:MAG: hypothetical protein J5379_02610 [Clostridiales bacterium]|nr:hypothetical protein [Clostridiales bacterium]